MPSRHEIYSAAPALTRVIDKIVDRLDVERETVDEIIAQPRMAGINLMARFAHGGRTVAAKNPIAGLERAIRF